MTSPQLLPTPPAAGGNRLLDAFPKRRLPILYAGAPDQVKMMYGVSLIVGLLAVLSLFFMLPDIVRDFGMNRAGKSVLDQTAEIDGSCKRMKFVFVSCDAKITFRPDPAVNEVKTVEQSFMFVGTDYQTTVDVLRSTIYPERVTTTLATEHLGNRFLTLTLLFGILGGIAVFGAREAWVAAGRLKLEGKSMVVQPLVVTVLNIDQYNVVKFKATIDGREIKTSNKLRDGDWPLYLAGTTELAVAVAVPGSPYLILLDWDLTALSFTEQERLALRAAVA